MEIKCGLDPVEKQTRLERSPSRTTPELVGFDWLREKSSQRLLHLFLPVHNSLLKVDWGRYQLVVDY